MTERISLEGKVAVVTGAGRGLGRAYVELLAERGARVVVNDLGTDVSGFGKDSTIAQQVADLIRSRGGAAIANESDISTAEGGSDLIATTIEHFGRIDLLVNNAGICGSQLFEHATLDDFDHYWRVHLGGPVNTVKAAWPHMVAQRYGKIILTTSVAGLFGIRGQATYAAAKCAVVGLMRILAMEGAEHGILVNTISPNGYTRMHPAAGSRMPERDGKATMPVEAVAPAIVWLASDGCAETNSIYNLEGGTIQRIAIVMGTWLLRSTSDTREHRRELRKGRIDRGLLRTGSFRAQLIALGLATSRADKSSVGSTEQRLRARRRSDAALAIRCVLPQRQRVRQIPVEGQNRPAPRAAGGREDCRAHSRAPLWIDDLGRCDHLRHCRRRLLAHLSPGSCHSSRCPRSVRYPLRCS